MNSVKYNGKQFINRSRYAQQKIFCICVDVYETNEGDDFDNIFEDLSTLKIKQLKINNTLTEIYSDMLENSDFEQDF